MKIMPCPLNGPRNISEFTFGGEVTPLPDVASAPDSEWAEHTFYSYNGTGIAREWWYHNPSGYWFIAERHRVTDEILKTYDPAELQGDAATLEQALLAEGASSSALAETAELSERAALEERATTEPDTKESQS